MYPHHAPSATIGTAINDRIGNGSLRSSSRSADGNPSTFPWIGRPAPSSAAHRSNPAPSQGNGSTGYGGAPLPSPNPPRATPPPPSPLPPFPVKPPPPAP